MLIVTAEQMKEIELSAIEYDITLPRLMENAGSAAATFIRRVFPVNSLNCVVFCGKGNNGGDGFVVARRLSENGAKVVVVLVEGPPTTEQSIQMYDALKTFEIPVLSIEDNRALSESYAKHADLLIDAIYGTGFNDTRLPTNSLIACQIMNDAPAAIVSLDLPSGISADRGNVAFGSVKADFTLVFQLKKPLHILPASMEACGDIQVLDIGIPETLYAKINSHFSFTSEKLVQGILPERTDEMHKGDLGHTFAICGSNQYRGAGVLAVSGSFAVGSALCTIIAPEVVCQSVINHRPEAIVQPVMVDTYGTVRFDSILPILEKNLAKASCILFGCGTGTESANLKILEYLINNSNVPIVLDADALDLLAERLDLLDSAKQPIILTPHPGEMAKLSATTSAFVQKNRVTTALDFANKYDVIVVLKGHGTLTAMPDGRMYLNETGGHGLARGGSGDLLAGMIAGLVAQGIEPAMSAVAGVWLHGSAGDRCQKRLSSRSMLPMNVLSDLSDIFKEFETQALSGKIIK